MGSYSSGIDAIFDSMSQASADSSSPPTLRSLSYSTETTETQPSIRVEKMNALEAKRRRRRSWRWRWPVLVWSAVALTALAARGTIVHSLGSLGPLGTRAPKVAAISADVAPAPSSAAVLRAPSRTVVSREPLRIEREEHAEASPLPSRTPAPKRRAHGR